MLIAHGYVGCRQEAFGTREITDNTVSVTPIYFFFASMAIVASEPHGSSVILGTAILVQSRRAKKFQLGTPDKSDTKLSKKLKIFSQTYLLYYFQALF